MSGSIQSCASAIRAAAPGLADDDIEELLSAMIRRERGMPNRSGDALRWREIAQAMTHEELRAVRIEKHARQAQLIAQTARDAKWTGGDAIQHISDLITTSQKAGAGRAYSAEAAYQGALREYQGALMAGWQQAGVTGWLRHIDPETERALAREIARLNGDTRIKATDNAELRNAAEVVVSVQTRMRQEMNRLGAFIEPLEGRVTRTSHDSRRIQQAGADKWVAYVMPRLDDRTWVRLGVDAGDTAAARAKLGQIYANLVSGDHAVVHTGKVDPLARAFGAASIGRAVSEDRILHWRTADDWLDYQREFGSANLIAAIVGETDHAARSTGIMRVWGPNAEAAIQRDVSRLAEKLRDGGRPEDAAALLKSFPAQGMAAGAGISSLRMQWAVLTGEADRPANLSMAHWGAAWRALETITSLGGMVLSSLPDLTATASALRWEGMSYWRTLGNQVAAMLPENDATRREVSTRLLAGMNGLLGGLYQRLGYDPSVPGTIARRTDLFFKLNLQNWWTNAQERGVASILSSHVGDNLSRGWADMDAGLRTSLERFGVTEAHWSQARGATLLRDRDGIAYFTPDMVDGEAGRRLSAWFAETMNGALTRPSMYTRSILTQGQAPGTGVGEALRLFTQFKSYPLSFLTTHWAREVGRGADGVNWSGLAGMIAGTTIMGAVSMTLKDAVSGRTPRTPWSDRGDGLEDAQAAVKWVGQAMTRGGGLGIYGDFIWGDYNRFGGGFLETAAGPAAGTLSQIGRLFTQMREMEDPRATAINVVAREMLPTNLFYAKLALDHLIIFRLQEAVNPGYLRRMERRVERENNQSFWLRPDAFQ